jgi:type I restriction enzyme, S subunit
MNEGLAINGRWDAKTLKEISDNLHQGINTAADRINYKDDGYKILQAKHITSCSIEDSDARNVSAEDYIFYKDKYRPRLNDILFSNIGTIGKSLVIKTDRDLLIAWNIFLIRLKKEVNAEFVNYYLRYLDTKNFYNSIATGVATMFVNKANLSKIVLPIPPKLVQQQIVSKIEELFSEVDRGIEEMKTAQQQLKVYRQSVLKWAFEGKLTNKGESETLEGWEIVTLGQIKQFSLYGPRFSSKDYSFDGVAILRTSDITNNGKVDWINAPKLDLSEKDYEKYKLVKNDLLITRTGSIGTISVFNDDKKAIPGAFLIHYRLKDEANSWFIFYYLTTTKAQQHFKKFSFGVGRPNLNVPNIELLKIPLPTLKEQLQIVQEIESRFSVCDKVEETIVNSIKQAEALRQSILRIAFTGKLVMD